MSTGGGFLGWVRAAVTAAVACVVVFSLVVEPLPGAAAPSRNDGNDAGGRSTWPGRACTRRSETSCSRCAFAGRRRRCGTWSSFRRESAQTISATYALRSGAAGSGGACSAPGQDPRRAVAVGVSSYGSDGAATRRRRIGAGVRKGGDGRLEPRLASRVPARPVGRCSVAGPARPAARAERAEGRPRPRRAAAAENACLDRTPEAGFAGARIFELRRTGCTVASPLVHHSGAAPGKKIALTFDDGPSAYTEQVVRILDRGGAEGTFFELGIEVPGRGR